MSPLSAISLPVVGLALAAILATTQYYFTPPAVYRAGEAQEVVPVIDPHSVPLVGSPDAPYIVKLLFDYRCSHCQQTHALLDEAIRLYEGKLAFLLCPSPLCRECNPYVARDVDEFKDSCDLARIALAVFVAKREAFPAFDTWMFTPEPGRLWRGRTLDAAKAKAIELIGEAAFEAARADPWIDKYLNSSTKLYGDTIDIAGGNAVPKLVLGTRWVTPEPHSVGDLVSVMQDRLALPKP